MNPVINQQALDNLNSQTRHAPPQTMQQLLDAHPFEAAKLYQHIRKHRRKRRAGGNVTIHRIGG